MDFDFHRLDAGADFLVEGMLAKPGEIRVFAQPFEITVTQVKRAIQRLRGRGKALRKRITTGQVVLHKRVAGAQARQLFVHFQTLFEAAAARVIVAQDLQGLKVGRIAPDNAFQEADFDVEIALFLSGQFLSGDRLARHTTTGIIAESIHMSSRACCGGLVK